MGKLHIHSTLGAPVPEKSDEERVAEIQERVTAYMKYIDVSDPKMAECRSSSFLMGAGAEDAFAFYYPTMKIFDMGVSLHEDDGFHTFTVKYEVQ